MATENETVVIKDLGEFIKWIGQFKDREYLFRGVSRVDYEIEASAYRRLSGKKTPERLLEINQELIEEASRQGHAQQNGQDFSDLELLAELQHFGAATGLIDFTRNVLVALWFACWECPSDNGKVVLLRGDGIEPLTKVDYQMSKEKIAYFFSVGKKGIYALYEWQPKHQNNRIIAQQSVFVFGGSPVEIETECEIQADSKQEILTELDGLFNITGASLFSDFDGFAWVHAHDKPHIKSTAKAYRIGGIEAFQNENLKSAINSFTRAIKLDSENPKADQERVIETYFHRARAYRHKGKFDKAIDDCCKAIKYYKDAINRDKKLANQLKPKLAEVYNNRGIAYENKGKYGKAIRDYKKALKLRPDYAKVYNNRGNAYAGKGKYGKAIKDYKKALKLRPDYALVYCNLGEVQLQKKKWGKAKRNLTKAKDRGVDIIYSFQQDYKSVKTFKKKTGITLPKDIAEMLTPPKC